jgi:hypothetical protein
MRSDPSENRYRRIALTIASRCLAAIIALSFLTTLLPAGTAAAKSIMACCKGKAAGHCHATVKFKQNATISAPCHSDCCAFTATAQKQKRGLAIARPGAKLVEPFAVRSQAIIAISLTSSADESNYASPRGPPTFLL